MKGVMLVVLINLFIPAILFAEDLTLCQNGWNTTQRGNHLAAVELFEQCIKKGKLSDASLARTYRNIGIAYQRAKAPRKAIAFYTKAIALTPLDVMMDYINRGNAYDEANMFDEAMADYDKAMILNPGYGEIYYNRGITYEHKGELVKAKKEFIIAYKCGLRSRLLYERLVVHGLI